MLKLLFAAVALTSATPIVAAVQDAPVSVRVSVADLDLMTDAGAEALDRRIARAARKICPVDWNTEFSRRLQTARCRKGVIAATAQQRERALANTRLRRSSMAQTAVPASGMAN